MSEFDIKILVRLGLIRLILENNGPHANKEIK